MKYPPFFPPEGGLGEASLPALPRQIFCVGDTINRKGSNSLEIAGMAFLFCVCLVVKNEFSGISRLSLFRKIALGFVNFV
jgi:hypothetical protein